MAAHTRTAIKSRRGVPGESPDPPTGCSSTAAPPPHHSLDYISIPDRLKSKPIAALGRSLGVPGLTGRRVVRLKHLLQYAGIRVLGDLDGKRLSDFGQYRGCGKETVSSLRTMILRALHPGIKLDRSAWPIPLWSDQPLPRALQVARGYRALRFHDLPVSHHLECLLRDRGIQQLGQLHGLPTRALLAEPSFGKTALAELDALLRRVETGEFAFSNEQLASKTPADLPRLIDDLVSGLPEKTRVCLTLHFGAAGKAGQSQRQIGRQYGMTESAVGQHVSRALERMRRQGSLKLQALLDCVGRVRARAGLVLNPALVATWQEPGRPALYNPRFYFHIITRLRPE